MAHATIAQFYAFQGLLVPNPIPSDVVARLNAVLDDASEVIDGQIRFGRYPTVNGVIVDTETLTVLARATCAQALYFENNPDARSEAIRQFDSVRAGSMSLSTNQGSSTGTGKGTLTTPVFSDRALRILVTSGILSNRVGGR